jgi:hypothetical protein
MPRTPGYLWEKYFLNNFLINMWGFPLVHWQIILVCKRPQYWRENSLWFSFFGIFRIPYRTKCTSYTTFKKKEQESCLVLFDWVSVHHFFVSTPFFAPFSFLSVFLPSLTISSVSCLCGNAPGLACLSHSHHVICGVILGGPFMVILEMSRVSGQIGTTWSSFPFSTAFSFHDVKGGILDFLFATSGSKTRTEKEELTTKEHISKETQPWHQKGYQGMFPIILTLGAAKSSSKVSG